MRRTHDLTIFAWGFGVGPLRAGVFAKTPADFAGCGALTQLPEEARGRRSPYTVTNVGVQITLCFLDVTERICYVLFETIRRGHRILAISMTWNKDQDDFIGRSAGRVPIFVPRSWLSMAHSKQAYILPREVEEPLNRHSICLSDGLRKHRYRVAEV